ncbi:hypothetical protein AAFF_G00126610 [Aldrovandia affinis]|uniref:Uncharacterized protein n=1 Tax=Aldrovandia affinis TaxID=143900 RepID=A0AAD7W9Z5_9TELE|nr:hypothetical protein AAFF_G00126610 [Aldrovandia affinis]
MKGLEGEEESTFYEPIKKNRVDFFRQVPASVDSSKQKVLKEDCQLFSKLFISCQSRECDLKEFFRHENQSHPAALSDGGKLHTCQKSHLTTILESQVTTPEAEPDDTIIIDGAAPVNSLPPRSSKTKLSQYPPVVDDEDLKTLEKFVVMMYDRSSTAEGVDDARLDMFSRKQRPYEAIPPTRSALKQHVKRAAYQAGCIWSQSTVCQPETQTPANWGWTKKGDLWQIVWTELTHCRELPAADQVWMQVECCSRCKCYCFGLTCTALCSCRCEV